MNSSVVSEPQPDHLNRYGASSGSAASVASQAGPVVPTVALEGFGLIAVESLAAGTPVLVTPVGGLPEVVRDLSGHMVMPDADLNTLSEYLVAVLNGSIRLPSSEACQEYARSRFDWPVIASQVRGVYEEVLS